MLCEGCGAEAQVMKTCRRRDGEGSEAGVLCDPCYAPLADSVWIVAGMVPAHGKCRSCAHWFSVGELAGLAKGGKWDAPSGLCVDCASCT